MRKMLGVLLLVALPVWAEDAPPGCAWLCGNWVFDGARSDTPATVVDAALEKYKEPEPRKPRPPRGNAPPEASDGDAAQPGPIYDRPTRAQMRAQLLALLTPPATLVLGEKGDEILIRSGDTPERHIFPGEPHSRVDAQGTAVIRANWKKDALIVNESYDSHHEQTETFALLPDGTLQLTWVVERRDVKPLRLRVVYRRR